MSALPSGTVTFVMTDVEGSTALWHDHGQAMDEAMDILDEQLNRTVAANGGVVIKARGEGDSHFAVFRTASEAVLALVDLQRARAGVPWPRVRVAVHAAEAEPRGLDYVGATVNRVARLRSAAHGGQIICTRAVSELAGDLGDVRLQSLGSHRVRDVPDSVEIFQVCAPGLPLDFPPLVTLETAATPVMTVVVIDQVGSVERVLVGDRPAAWQRPLFHRLRTAATEHDGRFLKLMGDGCLVAFEDPRAAVAFARQLCEDASRPNRAAVTAGLVEVIEGELSGTAVFEAFRRIREVGAPSIWISPVVEALLGRDAFACTH